MGNGILYIIGNGFDLFHGLKSSYHSYYEFIKKNSPNIEEFLEIYISPKYKTDDEDNNDYWWSDFENNLACFNGKQFRDEHDYVSEGFMDQEHPQWSDYFGVVDEIIEESEKAYFEIRQLFVDWINEISETEIERKNMHFEKDAFFLSFNYTSTIERIYNIPKVFHIHGYIDDNDEESIVFGHGEETPEGEIPELDENGESNRAPSSDAEAASYSFFYKCQKPVKDIIDKNQCFFESLRCIKKVVVLGHSLNKIDKFYFDKIKDITSTECKWTIVYFNDANDKNKTNAISAMKNLGISNQQYELLSWDKYVQSKLPIN